MRSAPATQSAPTAVVVVPAHDEAEHLPGCLESIAVAAGRVDGRVDVIVVLDQSDEATTAAAAAAMTGHDVRWRIRSVDRRNVGAARAAGFADADHDELTWFASTDADSRVGEDWLATHLELAADGADAVAGLVEPEDRGHWPCRMTELYDAHYNRVDGHPHVHGANLGVRASSYHRVGGFRPLPLDEDVDLVERLTAAGVVTARTSRSPVITSVREDGRTTAGFAGYLRALRQRADGQLIPSRAATDGVPGYV